MTVRIDADLLIPGRGEPIANGTVILDGGTIAFAGPASGAPSTLNADATHVPVVMPGLWECHAHFVGLEEPDITTQLSEPVARRAARAVGDLHRTLMGGVTSAREVGGHGLDIQQAIAAGQVRGPTVYGAGRILSTTGGHADIHSIPLDSLHAIDHLGLLCDGVPEVTRAVRLNLRRNARVIKICASGGVMSEVDHPIHQQFSHEELVAIVEEAGRAERIVAAHCHGLPGIMAALRAGVQTIEHGSYLDEEAADLMIEQGTIYVPTRFVIDTLLQQEDRLPRYAYEKGQIVADHQAAAMKLAVAKGVKIAMGTDIFVSGDLYGQNSYEIKLLQNAGMTALEAIEAATANGPDTLGRQAPLSGQLKESYDADAIAIDFNPLEDSSGWGDPARVTHVWKSGIPAKAPE
ncbi:MAG: amidohydrolase family protein [Acidimicrobiia bacterium]|nr:MAG: amidohydrolase family protein [Acidimicrobiia bacterium]